MGSGGRVHLMGVRSQAVGLVFDGNQASVTEDIFTFNLVHTDILYFT